nr:hypothetical protein JVH1_3938 [Rhodococcus sp. JVH1]
MDGRSVSPAVRTPHGVRASITDRLDQYAREHGQNGGLGVLT